MTLQSENSVKGRTTGHSGSSRALATLASDARVVADFVAQHGPVLVLTGAGISTASGIPEYRDIDGNWKHAKPVQYKDFIESAEVYQRYWARSAVGWKTMGRARPNAGHYALAELEQRGHVSHLITQNVDRLHAQAQHQNVVDLHGNLSTASCLSCSNTLARESLQQEMEAQNPNWFASVPQTTTEQKPDGDAWIAARATKHFLPPRCPTCGGKLKPDVVFFGEGIPQRIISAALRAQEQAGALLVVGSSLIVFSGFRIVRDFCARQLPVIIINQGKTRADDLPVRKIVHDANELLPLTASLTQ
ncbi:MAG: NAD-dependent protein deacetylase [Gammaproteobacteria bacterium]|nr:NAD-dependent protein deacetylase [Gammaproteobacteria bacterium]